MLDLCLKTLQSKYISKNNISIQLGNISICAFIVTQSKYYLQWREHKLPHLDQVFTIKNKNALFSADATSGQKLGLMSIFIFYINLIYLTQFK